MRALSKYEGAAKAFLTDHPIGTVVTADTLLAWATDHKNGLASDLLVVDPAKKLSALRRHLNEGGASRNHPEENRFYLAVEDAKRKTHQVVLLSDHVSAQTDAAFGKSMRGAISPLKSQMKAIEDVKLDELPVERREDLEQQLQFLVEVSEPVHKMVDQQVETQLIGKLMAKGHTREAAIGILSMLPSLISMHKLRLLTQRK